MTRAVRAVVHGQVQGVGFRWSCMHRAEALGLAGWVRNRPDGTVECWLEGPDAEVGAMLEWLSQGPRYARVARVDVEDQTPVHYSGFDVH